MNRLAAALILSVVVIGSLPAAPGGDEVGVRQLNADYVQAYLHSDVARFRELLTEDFRCVLADGREISRAEFLRQAASPPPVNDFRVSEVAVRLFGDAAIVNARAGYRRIDGMPIETRYVAVWVRRSSKWQIASVQFTRVGKPM